MGCRGRVCDEMAYGLEVGMIDVRRGDYFEVGVIYAEEGKGCFGVSLDKSELLWGEGGRGGVSSSSIEGGCGEGDDVG